MTLAIICRDQEQIQIELLLEGIYRRYGLDFRDYAYASIRRRVWSRMRAEELTTISAFQDRVLHDQNCMEQLLLALSITVTTMFRDPTFFRAFREKVVPLLRTYPFVNIWHAGCSTGEEVYSMAILLLEENLYSRCRIYATDMNEAVLQQAKEGIFPLANIKEYTQNYQQSGGARCFSEYYSAKYGRAILRPALRENIVFSQHNLATDGSFNEFNVILCRNVMIYFKQSLKDRALRLFHDSLCGFGMLVLGKQESILLSPLADHYEVLDDREKLYRRVA